MFKDTRYITNYVSSPLNLQNNEDSILYFMDDGDNHPICIKIAKVKDDDVT